jgi:hypothetical protein
MKLLIALTLMIVTLPAFGEAKKPKRETAAAAPKSACEQKVRALILKTAKAMGQKQDFGFELARETNGVDAMNRPLFTYNASVFIVPEGYISNSAASVVVRTPDTTCDIVKIAVSIGG